MGDMTFQVALVTLGVRGIGRPISEGLYARRGEGGRGVFVEHGGGGELRR
jgi:hypothetical protein